MAKYEPIGFEDEVPNATPLKYKITDDTEGVIAESATIELETPVIPGTPLNAANLNHIEQGIVELEASTPPGVFQAKGDLFVGAGSETGVRLPVGANGQVLQADNTQASGMRWAYEYLRDMIASKGDLLVGTGADSAARLPVGANGQVLRANSAKAEGVEWGVDPAIDLIEAKGDLLVGTSANSATRLPVGANGYVLRANSARPQGVEWVVDPAFNLIEAKGDLLVGVGSKSAARLPAGADGQELRADSSRGTGVRWVTPIVYGGPWGNPAWDGDPQAVSTTNVKASVFNSNVPDTAKMILIHISAKWATLNENFFVRVYPPGTPANFVIVRGNSVWSENNLIDASGWVPLSTDGRFVLEVGGGGTTFTLAQILAYMI